MKHINILFLLIFLSGNTFAQYKFSDEKRVACTSVKSQDITGTCWSFSTASFLEAELIRMGKKEVDLSEMFIVRNIYKDKARNYVLRQGNANFSQGALAHDLIRMYSQVGIVKESEYSGLQEGAEKHNHSEMEAALKGLLDGVVAQKNPSLYWPAAVEGVLDAYLGEVKTSTDPKAYAKSLGINPADYVSLTSFSHHPFGSSFILEIPDNYSNGSFHNLSIDDLMSAIDHALANGYSIAWDGDVSERTMSAHKGLALLPTDPKRDSLFTVPGEEVEVTQESRQEAFERLKTTDDHLMHLIGTAVDERGTKYYIVKNSWGEISDYEGYVYLSEAYVRMKTVGILLHKDGLPKNIRIGS